MVAINDYQLFLFDFDGLLVNTEELHWKAYRKLCAFYGFDLNETFLEYCLACHSEATGPRDYLYRLFPDLKTYNWQELYEKKCEIYSSLIEKTELMPGAKDLLQTLNDRGIKRAVVTHSCLEHIATIRSQHPILQTISHWITREDYTQPKPNPECYQVAIERLAEPGDRIIGFEDSPRGLNALKGTEAQPVIVCSNDYPPLKELLDDRVVHLPSLLRYMFTG